MMLSIDKDTLLLLIIACTLLLVLYTNSRIKELQRQINTLGGIVFAQLDCLTISNQAQKDICSVLRNSVNCNDDNLDLAEDSAAMCEDAIESIHSAVSIMQ